MEGAEAELRRALRERDERLLALEGECAKWEQRYLEEAALRQAAVSAASIPKYVLTTKYRSDVCFTLIKQSGQ